MIDTKQTWETIADEYKTRLLNSIPPEWRLTICDQLPLDVHNLVRDSGLLSEKELEINNLDARSIRDGIATKIYSAVEVTTTFLKAAAIAHQATNCLMAYFPEEALERARWLDEEMTRTGMPVGPLHGVPISVKGVFHVCLRN
jgi:hypothetical protein